MEWIITNWYILLAIVVLLIFAGILIYKFAGLPPKEQIKKVKAWLLYAVIQAERELGNKTGILKLRKVYDSFIAKWHLIAMIISFETFSKWVDEALVEMKKLLDTNDAVKNYIERNE